MVSIIGVAVIGLLCMLLYLEKKRASKAEVAIASLREQWGDRDALSRENEYLRAELEKYNPNAEFTAKVEYLMDNSDRCGAFEADSGSDESLSRKMKQLTGQS